MDSVVDGVARQERLSLIRPHALGEFKDVRRRKRGELSWGGVGGLLEKRHAKSGKGEYPVTQSSRLRTSHASCIDHCTCACYLQRCRIDLAISPLSLRHSTLSASER